MQKEKTKKRQVWVEGAIPPTAIAQSIAKHQTQTKIGAHQLFLGQVRADVVEGKTVSAIEYSAYKEMAESVLEKIREGAFTRFDITCLHIHHSLGTVEAGGICLFVFVSASHRKAASEAVHFIVEAIKSKVPIFGKEIFGDQTYQWKTNK